MPRTRRNFTPAQKAAILREHLVDRVAISDLCDKHGLRPALLYRWQRELFENLPSIFAASRPDSRLNELESQNAALREKLARKDEVIAEVTEDLINAKKKNGGR